jgi:hypothetical protein
MRFKEWLLAEEERIILKQKMPLTIWTDAACSQKQTIIADFIDVRWEDWAKEGSKPIFRMDGGTTLQGNVVPKPTAGTPFSAPLADGRFLNWNNVGSQTVDNRAAHPLIRKDWARFAEFINGNVVVKNPMMLRATDSGAARPAPTTIG